MPRIATITNFDGQIMASQPWVMQQIKNITAGTTNVFVKDTLNVQQLQYYMASINGVTGNIVIIENGTAKGSYIFTNDDGAYKAIGSGSLSGQTEQIIKGLFDRVTTVQTDIGSILDKTIQGNSIDYKIKSSVLPQLAITRVYTINANQEQFLTFGVRQLMSAALGSNSAQTGDLVIITSQTIDRTDVSGNYVITRTLSDPAQITESDYVKMYVSAGTVVTVNHKAPTGGNVQLSITDIDGVQVQSIESVINEIKIKDVSLAFKSSVDLLDQRTGILQNFKETTQEKLLQIDDIAKDIDLIQRQQTTNIQAIQRAVQLVQTTVTLVDGQSGVTVTKQFAQDGQTVKSTTVNVVITGRVLQVWDENNKMIIPDITYSTGNGKTTLIAKYTKTVDRSWTILRTQPIVVNIQTI